MKAHIKSLLSHARFRQATGLFAVNIIGIPIGIITSVVLTRYLGAQAFGDLKFIQSIFGIAVVIFSFGFFQAGNRALVVNNNVHKAREYYGAELVILILLFFVMSIGMCVYALFDPNIHDKGLGKVLLILVPFGWTYLMLRYFEILLQADNKIGLLAKVRLYPKIGVLVVVLGIHFYFQEVGAGRLIVVLGSYIVIESAVYAAIAFKLRLSFKNLLIRIKEIWGFNRSFGFDVYVGSLFAVGFAQLVSILISYYGMDNKGVGFYSLALVISMPLAFIPNTIATTHYKDFSTSKVIPRRLVVATLSISLLALLLVLLLVDPFVVYVYGDDFLPVAGLVSIVSVGVLIHGMADFYNRYLGANGQGRALRNSSFFVGGSTLVSSFLLVPTWGEVGAAYVRVVAGVVYLVVIYYFYRGYIDKISVDESADKPSM